MWEEGSAATTAAANSARETGPETTAAFDTNDSDAAMGMGAGKSGAAVGDGAPWTAGMVGSEVA